jgi:hypothetical protein
MKKKTEEMREYFEKKREDVEHRFDGQERSFRYWEYKKFLKIMR